MQGVQLWQFQWHFNISSTCYVLNLLAPVASNLRESRLNIFDVASRNYYWHPVSILKRFSYLFCKMVKYLPKRKYLGFGFDKFLTH